MEIQSKKFTPITITFVVIWLLYTVVYGVLRNNPATANIYGFMPFVCLSILDIAAIIFAITLYRKSLNQNNKKIFLLFLLAFCFSFWDDILYNLSSNIFHLPKETSPSWMSIADNLVFIADLSCLTLIWIKIFSVFTKQTKNSKKISSFAWILSAIIIVWTILTQWQGTSTADKIFTVVEDILYLMGFVFALFCLATAKNRGLFYTALGFCVARISDFIFSFQLIAQQYAVGSMLETAWIIVLLFYVYGLSQFIAENKYSIPIINWVREK